MAKIPVGILGATGAVGQNYALLLEPHPWFEVAYVAASPNSAGKTYEEAVKGKWFMDRDMPNNLRDLVVGDASKVEEARGKCSFIFSSYESGKKEDKDKKLDIQETEMAYAAAGIPVVSNNSAHRWTEDVPMIIPEINSEHIHLINSQRKNKGFDRGFIVTKPNCSVQSFLTPIYALMRKGYLPKKMIVFTQQAISGAGYPGISSLDIQGNVIPYISGEEEKTEREPFKILRNLKKDRNPLIDLDISATCTRVPVIDGHLASVNLELWDETPSLEEIIEIWQGFVGVPQELGLPSAPNPAIIYREEADRPQPRKDCNSGNGMAVIVGRLRKCDALGVKFIGLSHNTIRGAAGGAILTAELLFKASYIKS